MKIKKIFIENRKELAEKIEKYGDTIIISSITSAGIFGNNINVYIFSIISLLIGCIMVISGIIYKKGNGEGK